MDEETLQRLFEPFFTTNADVGTELGLSTAYAEIKRWDGTIRAESAAGEGTLFGIKLPLWTGEVSGAMATPAEALIGTKPPVSSLRVLIAADEAIVRMMLETEMEDGGHDVRLSHRRYSSG